MRRASVKRLKGGGQVFCNTSSPPTAGPNMESSGEVWLSRLLESVTQSNDSTQGELRLNVA